MARKSKHPKQDDRCQHTTADGRRCRAPRMNQHATLCLQHGQRQQQLLCTESLDADALAAELLGPFQELKTAAAVTHALGKLFALVAKNRIPTRNAALLTYIGQVLLNSLALMREETLRGEGTGLKLVLHHIPRPQRPDSGNAAHQATVTPDKEAEQKTPIEG